MEKDSELLVSLKAVEKADLGKLIVGMLQHLDRLQGEVDALRREVWGEKLPPAAGEA